MNKLRSRGKLNLKKKGKYIIPAVLMLIALGFAYISAELGMNAKARVGKIAYDVHFEEVSNINGTMSASEDATIDEEDKTKIDFELDFTTPGEYYEFDAVVYNEGTIDAELTKIDVDIPEEASKYISITYRYADGIEMKEHDLLKSGERETIRVRVEFLSNIEIGDIPTEGTELDLSFDLTYTQDLGEGKLREKVPQVNYSYVVSNTTMRINQTIPDGVVLRSTAEEAITDWGSILGEGNTRPYYLKHKLNDEDNNKIKESYVEFIYNGQTYTLRGGVNESTKEEKPIYESNKEVLISAFGSDHCTDFSSNFNCDADGLIAGANSDGDVIVRDVDGHDCGVNNAGNSSCYW